MTPTKRIGNGIPAVWPLARIWAAYKAGNSCSRSRFFVLQILTAVVCRRPDGPVRSPRLYGRVINSWAVAVAVTKDVPASRRFRLWDHAYCCSNTLHVSAQDFSFNFRSS